MMIGGWKCSVGMVAWYNGDDVNGAGPSTSDKDLSLAGQECDASAAASCSSPPRPLLELSR